MDYVLLIPVAAILCGCWINHRYPLTEEEEKENATKWGSNLSPPKEYEGPLDDE